MSNEKVLEITSADMYELDVENYREKRDQKGKIMPQKWKNVLDI